MRRTINRKWLVKNDACSSGLEAFIEEFGNKRVCVMELLHWACEKLSITMGGEWLLDKLYNEDSAWGNYVFSVDLHDYCAWVVIYVSNGYADWEPISMYNQFVAGTENQNGYIYPKM